MVAATGLGRRARKKLETRRRILEAAFELFARQGFQATTVEAIADRADVGKGTVFNYFPRKTAFLAALAEEWLQRMTEELGPVEEWPGTTRDRLQRVFRYLADVSVQDPPLARMVFFESMRHIHSRIVRHEPPPDEEAPPPDEAAPAAEFEAIAAALIREGIERGEIRRGVSVEDAASLVAAAFFHTLIRWLVRGGSTERMQEAIQAKLEIIFRGLAAPGPRGPGGPEHPLPHGAEGIRPPPGEARARHRGGSRGSRTEGRKER